MCIYKPAFFVAAAETDAILLLPALIFGSDVVGPMKAGLKLNNL
jgi:hypothetical protein